MRGLRLAAELVHGALGDPGQPFERPVDALAGADEERVDEVLEVEARLADEQAAARGRARNLRSLVSGKVDTSPESSHAARRSRRPQSLAWWPHGDHAARPAMAVGFQVYDQEHEAPARRGNVVDLWGVEEDWEFPTQGALALQPAPVEPDDYEPGQAGTSPVRFESTGHLRYRAADGYDGSPGLRRAREAAPA